MRTTLLIFLFFCFNSCQLLPSQEEPITKPVDIQEKSRERVKLGLFISGAGVHTFASLPLLELLQRENIHFDFIAGTGWGAWLAAFYAKNHSVDELKWNLFKLKEQNIFEIKWFDPKKKRAKLLKTLIEETLPSPLQTSFTCPVLDKQGRISWLGGKKPVQAVLSCLNLLPPLFFSFDNITKQGSLFSVEPAMEHIWKQGIDIILWIKPSFRPNYRKNKKEPFSSLWKELFAHLNQIQKRYLRMQNQVIILETTSSSFFLDDFSKINAIIKISPPSSEKKKIDKLKRIIEEGKRDF